MCARRSGPLLENSRPAAGYALFWEPPFPTPKSSLRSLYAPARSGRRPTPALGIRRTPVPWAKPWTRTRIPSAVGILRTVSWASARESPLCFALMTMRHPAFTRSKPWPMRLISPCSCSGASRTVRGSRPSTLSSMNWAFLKGTSADFSSVGTSRRRRGVPSWRANPQGAAGPSGSSTAPIPRTVICFRGRYQASSSYLFRPPDGHLPLSASSLPEHPE